MNILKTVSTTNISCEFSPEFLKLQGERLRLNHFCKVSLVEQLKYREKCLNLHLRQKFCHLHCYVTRRSSPTLKLSKNFQFTGVGDSLSAGCSATKFELENVGKCFMKSSPMKFLFSKLQ